VNTGETLPGVNIVVLDGAGNPTGHGTITDVNGIFDLRGIPAGRAVQFSYIGYRITVPTLQAFPAQNTVTMQRDPLMMPEVVATDKQTYVWAYVLAAAVAAVALVLYLNKN
jgi:hypothetical protein